MPTVKRIICLANSRKMNDRCIAGKDLSTGAQSAQWIRPVSTREPDGISQKERQYADGSEPCPLDIIDIGLTRAKPTTYQQENWLLDPGRRWVKVGQALWDHLEGITEPAQPLWINNHNTYNGLNDQIPLPLAETLTCSLRLIRISQLVLSVFAPGAAFSNPKRRVQGRFRYQGTDYWLWVTDPIYEQRYLEMPNGNYTLNECLLTISLSEPHNSACYKLIAAIIEQAEG